KKVRRRPLGGLHPSTCRGAKAALPDARLKCCSSSRPPSPPAGCQVRNRVCLNGLEPARAVPSSGVCGRSKACAFITRCRVRLSVWRLTSCEIHFLKSYRSTLPASPPPGTLPHGAARLPTPPATCHPPRPTPNPDREPSVRRTASLSHLGPKKGQPVPLAIRFQRGPSSGSSIPCRWRFPARPRLCLKGTAAEDERLALFMAWLVRMDGGEGRYFPHFAP